VRNEGSHPPVALLASTAMTGAAHSEPAPATPAPTFSVIVPTCDRPELLREAVGTVLAQTFGDLECIVVDDAGTQALDLPADPRLRVLHHERRIGAGAARNTGLDAARGTFVAFLDDDDLWGEDRLAVALEGHRHAPIVVCGSHYLGERPGSPRRLEGNVHDQILDGVTPHLGATSIAGRSCPRFDARYRACQDIEWWLRVTETVPVHTVDHPVLKVRRHAGPRVTNSTEARVRFSLMLLDEFDDYFRTHPRAAAFRWFRIGLMADAAGDRRLARDALARSLRLRPSARAVVHLLAALRPSTQRIT
jgi:glycosyltransferase involved in cell wall biosynthesis